MAGRKRTPEEEATRRALQRLVQYPEWDSFLQYFKDLAWRETVDRASPNPSALLLIEGRRSLLRDIERLPERLRDDRSEHTAE